MVQDLIGGLVLIWVRGPREEKIRDKILIGSIRKMKKNAKKSSVNYFL